MRVLVTSVQDMASQTIHKILLEDFEFKEQQEQFEGNPVFSNGSALLITTNRDLIHCNHLDNHFDAEVFIFCSRHRSQSGRPALLVHSTGNFGYEAEFGGTPKELSISVGSLVRVALQTLYLEREENNLNEFDVTLEVTHHGPTSMQTPLLFVELGSNEQYWGNLEGARAVANAAMKCVQAPLGKTASIGFGGTHYASKFNKLVLQSDIPIGHIAPKYALSEISKDVVEMMVQRSYERVDQAIIDWKGTNAENKKLLIPPLEDLGLEVIRASKM